MGPVKISHGPTFRYLHTDGVPCCLPPTYVGVRRVRDNAVMLQCVTPRTTLFERDDCNRNNNLNDRLILRASNKGGGDVGDCATACDPRTVVGRDLREDDSSMMPTTSSPVVSSSSTTGTAGMCYMINGRRMTKAEKLEMKHCTQLRRAPYKPT